MVVARLRRRSSRWLRASIQPATVLGLTMIAACWLGVTYILSIEDSKSVEGAVQQGANLARLVEENIVSTLNGIDRTLLLLREAYERDPDRFDLRDWTKRAIVTDLTLRLSVVGADGFMTGATPLVAGDLLKRIYLGDRDYFLAQVDAKTDDPFIGKPLTGRFSGTLTAQISRRLRHPDGSFAGTIVAALDQGFVERFLGAVDLGPRGTALLRSRDGVILASRGFKGQVVGRQAMSAVLRDALARAPSGHYSGQRRDRTRQPARLLSDRGKVSAARVGRPRRGLHFRELLAQPRDLFDHRVVGDGAGPDRNRGRHSPPIAARRHPR